jgi:hypothetical protein
MSCDVPFSECLRRALSGVALTSVTERRESRMPATTFGADKVRKSATSYPKLKLDKGQIARIVCIEKGPVYEWVHSLNKPKISPVDGKPKMIWVKKKGSDEQYQDHDMEFVGTPICLGDPDVLEEKGVDPAKCPACRLAAETDYLKPPSRRFAIHILQYETKPGTPNLITPFSVRCLAWVMSEGRFTQVTQVLSEFATEGEDPDPRKVDLILGPCENQAFQNYSIKAAQACALVASKDNLTRGMETYKENQADDLSPLCGRKADLRYLTNDLSDIQETWHKIRNGGPSQVVEADVTDSLDSSLLDSAVSTNELPVTEETKGFSPTKADAAPGQGDPLNEFKVGGSAQEIPGSAEEEPAAAKPADSDVPDLDDLLATLDVKI